MPSMRNGDIDEAKKEGKIEGTKRNIVVNYTHIYPYDKRNYGIQIRR